MSAFAVEKVLYDLGMSGRNRKAFVEDAAGFLAKYPLTDEEATWLRTYELSKLVKSGANPMLVMGYWVQLEGKGSIPSYMKRLRENP
jgi:protocatechuate 4,5-dioxygenase alpha chain